MFVLPFSMRFNPKIERLTNILAWVCGSLVFLISYIYCIAAYGYLFGVGLGWLPSLISGALAFAIVWSIWPIFAGLIGAVALFIVWLWISTPH